MNKNERNKEAFKHWKKRLTVYLRKIEFFKRDRIKYRHSSIASIDTDQFTDFKTTGRPSGSVEKPKYNRLKEKEKTRRRVNEALSDL